MESEHVFAKTLGELERLRAHPGNNASSEELDKIEALLHRLDQLARKPEPPHRTTIYGVKD